MQQPHTDQPQNADNNALIIQAATAWARAYYQAEVAAYLLEMEEEDEPGRYIVSLAVQGYDLWQAAEVWLENNAVVAINDIGEGLPPANATWPWPP